MLFISVACSFLLLSNTPQYEWSIIYPHAGRHLLLSSPSFLGDFLEVPCNISFGFQNSHMVTPRNAALQLGGSGIFFLGGREGGH